MLYIRSADQNRACILVLGSHVFHTLCNTPTIVGTARRGHGCGCVICVQMIIINMHIVISGPAQPNISGLFLAHCRHWYVSTYFLSAQKKIIFICATLGGGVIRIL